MQWRQYKDDLDSQLFCVRIQNNAQLIFVYVIKYLLTIKLMEIECNLYVFKEVAD